MRKLLLGVVAAAAIATPLVAATAANAATTDANGVITVTKGEVQSAFGWNNGAFDANVGAAKDVKFTGILVQHDNETRWQCSGGVQSQTSRGVQAPTFNATQPVSGTGKQINGWTLGGPGVGGAFVSGTRLGAAYVGYCPAGEYFTGFLGNVFTDTVLPGGDLKVTSGTETRALTVAPYVAPAV